MGFKHGGDYNTEINMPIKQVFIESLFKVFKRTLVAMNVINVNQMAAG